jgi:hypothetical protein
VIGEWETKTGIDETEETDTAMLMKSGDETHIQVIMKWR